MQTLAHNSADGEPRPEVVAGSIIPYPAPCSSRIAPLKVSSRDSATVWYRPVDLASAVTLVAAHPPGDVRIVVGNTSTGVFPQTTVKPVVIDFNFIPELHATEINTDNISFGAAVSLSDVASTLFDNLAKSPGTFRQLSEHIRNVANVNVRNVASWAGNLMITHDHEDFTSDIATIMTAARAQVVVRNGDATETYYVEDFVNAALGGKV